MRARLIDPVGPLWQRVSVPILGVLLFYIGAKLPAFPGGERAALVVYLLGFAALYLSPMILGRHKPRDVEVLLGPGYIAFGGAGRLAQRIRARDLTGATTARIGDGLSLALARKWRRGVPILLELSNETDVRAVRNALGIGHDGFGSITWPTDRRASDSALTFMRVLGFVAIVLAVALGVWASNVDAEAALLHFLIAFASCLTSLAALVVGILSVSQDESGPSVRMRADGLHLTAASRNDVSFDAIAGVTSTEEGMTLRLFPSGELDIPIRSVGRYGRGLSDEERAHVVAHIDAAGQRAQGAGAPRSEAATRVEVLTRGPKEEPQAWLARVDGAAATLGQSGYRGSSLDPGDLWKALEDPDADTSLRAAAARVLVRVDPTTALARVDAVVAAMRDPAAAQRVRIAVSPDAGEELAAIEEAEFKKLLKRL